MVGHTLPHFPILLYLIPPYPLSTSPVHTHIHACLCVPLLQESNFSLSLSRQ